MSGRHTIELPDGTVRRLGNNRPPAGLTKSWKVFGDTPDTPMIPRAQWPALITAIELGPDFPFLPPVHDQDGIGQCNAEDTVTLMESLRMQQGLPPVQLSAGDLYDRINGGSDNGSLLEDAIHEAMTNGVGTAATCGGTLWHRGFRDAPASERAKYKLLEANLCPTFDHIMSSVLRGWRQSSGIEWYDNYNPGADGWLPPPRGNSGGHAIFGFKPTMRTGKGGVIEFGVWHRQSWGSSWAASTDNCFVIPERGYLGQVGGWWAGRSVTDEGGVIPTPA